MQIDGTRGVAMVVKVSRGGWTSRMILCGRREGRDSQERTRESVQKQVIRLQTMKGLGKTKMSRMITMVGEGGM